MRIQKLLFLFAALVELVLGFPFFGGLLIISLGWTPLGFALIMHIIILGFALVAKPREPLAGSIIGIIANSLGIIPILGMLLHLSAALINFIQALSPGIVLMNVDNGTCAKEDDDDVIEIL